MIDPQRGMRFTGAAADRWSPGHRPRHRTATGTRQVLSLHAAPAAAMSALTRRVLTPALLAAVPDAFVRPALNRLGFRE